MFKKKYIAFLISSFSALGLIACGEEKAYSDREENQPSETVSLVSIQRQKRMEAPGMETLAPGESEAIVIDNSIFSIGSILYISQLGNDDSKNPNFNNFDDNAIPYLYQYAYNGNTEADWDEDFNFQNVEGREPITWSAVKNVGSVGNSFDFFAMFFPGNNSPVFNVKQDQTGPENDPYDQSNFKMSDILGAYHNTSSLYTRMRFRLFHLMTYLKITLYVPVYQDAIQGNDQSYSGFKEGAVSGAYLLGAATNFNINWRAKRSSDTEAPLVQRGNVGGPIKMYMHEPDNEEMTITVADYYNNPQNETDQVVAYNFSVLFPQPNYNPTPDNLQLCFLVTSPDNNVKYYYFNTSQVMNDSGSFLLSQGTLQQLYLYLPRSVNETILIGAKILPWTNSDSDMTVFEHESGATYE